jgi:6-phosphogluconolactonase
MERAGLDRRAFLAVASAAAIGGMAPRGAASATDRPIVYLGSFTSSGNPRGRGLEIGEVDPATGRLTVTGHVDGVADASFLALSPGGRTLYAVNELKPRGTVTALDIGGDPRRPAVLGTQPSGGSGPTHLSIHPGRRHLLTANYGDGTVAVHPLSIDGHIGPPTDIARHPGEAHAHQALTDPSGQWVVATDVGVHSIFVYGLDLGSGKLRLHQHLRLPEGFGPRHLVFHPGGRYAYILGERASQVTVAAWDAAAGRFTPGQVIGTLGEAQPRRNFAAGIQLSRDGRFLYASNRGHDSIAMFRVEASGERLAFGGTTPSGGAWPRHFTLDPSERWLYVANQRSNAICWLPRDAGSGGIGAPAGSTAVNSVGMLLFR